MVHVHADPLPAPSVDCGRMVDWPERYVFNTTDGIAHLECVEARDAGAAALDDEQLERALREALKGDAVALVALLQEEARRRFPPPLMGLPAALMTKR
jgi:hypothetical protein